MAAEFIGVTVLVTLKDPPDTRIQGIVQHVVQQQLTLSEVTWLDSDRRRTSSFVVQGTNIHDLEVIPNVIPTAPPQSLEQHFDDPAILSYSKPSTSNGRAASGFSNEELPITPQELRSEATNTAYTHARPITLLEPTVSNEAGKEGQSSLTEAVRENSNSLATATLTRPFDELSINGNLYDNRTFDDNGIGLEEAQEENVIQEKQIVQPLDSTVKNPGKRTRRGAKNKAARDPATKTPAAHLPAFKDAESSPKALRKHDQSSRSRGWRQTPLTEDASLGNLSSSHTAGNASWHMNVFPNKNKSRHQRIKTSEDQNGWATEEATDIQDMGDFDFEANLSKFDKRTVFDQIKHDDTTTDEARLVSFNRLPPRPGTTGGKNLHYTENVLDSPQANSPAFWNSEASDSERKFSDTKISSGRSSRRNISRTSIRKPPSRKGSAMASGTQHTTSSGLLPDARARYSSFDQTGSPKPKPKSPQVGSLADTFKASLRIIKSSRACPCITPLQMLELEQLAMSELGLTEDMMTENAARGIAETGHKVLTLSDAAGRDHLSLSPSIVILAGNNKSGARAIAGGRHLRNHGARVVICVLGLEREEDLLESVRRQLSIYRSSGGKVTKYHAVSQVLKHIHAPMELVIDALLGMHMSFDDLRIDDQAVYFELASWVKNSGISVLAIDVPSGLDASSGTATITDGTDLMIPPNFVLSLGAPKTGLLTALGSDPLYEHWKLLVADIGISNTAWRKFGTRRRVGVDFGREWVVGLRYQGGAQ